MEQERKDGIRRLIHIQKKKKKIAPQKKRGHHFKEDNKQINMGEKNYCF